MDFHLLEFDIQMMSRWNSSLIALPTILKGALAGAGWLLGCGVSMCKGSLPKMLIAHLHF